MSLSLDQVRICGCYATQPIGTFFVGVIPAKTLRYLAYSDIRRFEGIIEGKEENVGLQRLVSPKRAGEIKEYVKTADATFPSSIIVTVKSEDVLEQDDNVLTLRYGQDVAKIIDGQHRLAGFNEQSDNLFDLVISVFIDLDLEDQGYIFSTINLKQVRVDKSLVYDLFELSSTRSPQKTCHDIAKSVNSDSASPFYRRIKLLGRNPRIGKQTLYTASLSQATFVEQLIRLISNNADQDRDTLKRGQDIVVQATGVENDLIFRSYFAKHEDWVILRIINNYFGAVKNIFPDEWASQNSPLSRSIGFMALMKLLVDLYPGGEQCKDLTRNYFQNRFPSTAKELNIRFAPEGKYAASGQGVNDLYNDLKNLV